MGTVSRVHTFASGAILTAAQLNNEFDNLLTSSAINGGLDATNLGVTAGQATASKALVVDASRNLADATGSNRINNLALSGTFESTGAVTASAGITSGGNIVSDTDSTDDLGTTGVRWANLFVDDVTVTNNVTIGGTLTLTGGITLNGNTTIGDSSADTLTVNSTITSNLIFTDATYDIGASGATRPRDLFLSRNAVMGGTLGVTGLITATGGVSGALTGNVTGDLSGNVTGGTISGTTGTFSSTLAVTGVSTLTGRVGIGGSTITDGHLLNIQGSTSTDNVGVVLNKTNSTAQIWAINNTGSLNFNNFTSTLVPLQISSNNETIFKPSSSNGTLTVKVGSINSDSIRLEAGGTTSTWLESRGYLGHSWYVDSTRSMTLDSTGLGVGTDSPQVDFHVDNASTNGVARISTSHTSSYAQLQLVNQSGNYWYQTIVNADNSYRLYNGSDRLTVLSDGKTGIGTSSPAALIHAEAADGAAGGAIKYTAKSVASAYLSASPDGAVLATDTAGIVFRTGITGNDPTDTGTERLRITSAGLVGIGTSSPSAKLTVDGGDILVETVRLGENPTSTNNGEFSTFSTGAVTVGTGASSTVDLFTRQSSAASAAGTVYVSCESAGGVRWGYIIDFFHSNNTFTTTSRETGNSQGTTTCTIQENSAGVSVTVTYAGGIGSNISYNAGGHASILNY